MQNYNQREKMESRITRKVLKIKKQTSQITKKDYFQHSSIQIQLYSKMHFNKKKNRYKTKNIMIYTKKSLNNCNSI